MAYADKTDGSRIIVRGIGPAVISLSEAVKPGDLIGLTGGTWKLADGNAKVYAELVAGEAGASGDKITAYKSALVRHADSGGAKGDLLYLSDTAGATSATAGTVQQLVGQVMDVVAATYTEYLLNPEYRDGFLRPVRSVAPATEKKATVSADTTLAIADCGIVQDVDTDAKTITLPATHVGDIYIVRNAGADGTVLVTISPQAADKISGAGLTPADNKDLLNTKATAKKGDYVKLISDGVDGYVVAEMVGTWAREA